MTNIKNIEAKALSKLLNDGNVLVIDVREPAEYRAESIEGSVNIPLSKISPSELDNLNYKKEKIVIHCLSGKRSMSACSKLSKLEIDCDIWNLDGGINAWKDAKLNTLLGKSAFFLPLDRQIQLTIGMLMLAGISLGHYVSAQWLILPTLISFGLISAGLTGWCGMARLLAKMPWNK